MYVRYAKNNFLWSKNSPSGWRVTGHFIQEFRKRGKSLGADRPPPWWGLKGPKYAGSNKVKQESSYKLLRELSNQVLSSGISKETHISMFISGDTGRGHVSDLVKCDISYDLHYL